MGIDDSLQTTATHDTDTIGDFPRPEQVMCRHQNGNSLFTLLTERFMKFNRCLRIET